MSAEVGAAVCEALGWALPSRVVTNDELAGFLDTTDAWIRTRTGIRQRHVIAPGESTGDLAVEAGRVALDTAGVKTVDAVVVATSTPDRPCPATGPEVAARLGLGYAAAFDVAAVCTGFVYALATARGLIATGSAETVLVIGADTFSTILAPDDRTTRAVFGDGAGAVLLRGGDPGEAGALLGLDLGSDGSRSELIEVPGGGSRQRSTGLHPTEKEFFFSMRGGPVFSEAVVRMASSIDQAAARTHWSVAEVDRFVLHQANARILAAVADRLDVPVGRFVSNIAQVGNTVAASIPLAMVDGVASGALRPGQRVILAGFGGGLTWGAVALRWPRLGPVGPVTRHRDEAAEPGDALYADMAER